MVTTCPHCGKKFTAPDSRVGSQATCPGCQQAFTVMADDSQPTAEPQATAPANPVSQTPAPAGLSFSMGTMVNSGSIAKVLLVAGLVLAVFSRGCDSIGNRGVARAEAKVQVARNDDASSEKISKLREAASNASAKNAIWAYWREWLFVIGTMALVIGLLLVGFLGTGPERIVCLVMLAILTFSVYVGGIAWVASVASSVGGGP